MYTRRFRDTRDFGNPRDYRDFPDQRPRDFSNPRPLTFNSRPIDFISRPMDLDARPRDFRDPFPRMDFNGPAMQTHFDRTPRDFYGMPRESNEYGNEQQYHDEEPRRVHCGELREQHVGMKVTIAGKVHKQRLGRFLVLKDSNGLTQVTVPDDKPYLVRKVMNIPVNSFVVVAGIVNSRPQRQKDRSSTTGSIEVHINKIVSVHVKGLKEARSINKMQVRQASRYANALGTTTEEFQKCTTPGMTKKFSKRTHNCGELNTSHHGLKVVLCGWIEAKNGRFVRLRDGYGLVQAVMTSVNSDVYNLVENCTTDTLVQLTGEVDLRPEAQINTTIPTGEIEVRIQNLEIMKPDDDDDEVDGDVTKESSDNKDESITDVNSFTYRTLNCGQLREEHVGQSVTLCGWLEYHRVAKFVILRDSYGRTQLIIPEENKELQQLMDKVPYESIIKVEGVVTTRLPGSEQMSMATGKVEVVVQKLTILNSAANTLPFNIREHNKPKESLRMQYRYLDLRYDVMQRNLRIRSKLLMDMRDFLVNHADFVDVETPTLFRATPGGAQEFVVPTRFSGQFYSLVQSPQQFKQILMSGGVDRYFQIARCYRDEGARSDRQPEFTQLDVEMSFTTRDGVLALVERLLKHCWPKCLEPLKIPFERIPYEKAMEEFGSDKPNVHITQTKITDCTEILTQNTNLINDDDFTGRALIFPKPYHHLTNSMKVKYSTLAKNTFPKVKLVQQKVTNNVEEWILSMKGLLGDTVPKALIEHLHLNDECALFLAYGNKKQVLTLLGKLRVEFATNLKENDPSEQEPEKLHFMWVVDFPLFEEDENGGLASAHHPFTSYHPDDVELLKTEPFKVRSLAYDLVLNGNEVGGGSIRIHNAIEQKSILDLLKIDSAQVQYFLNALSSGCPPHGGIALGLDRLLAVMLRTKSIRDVIAFPKGLEGRDPLSGAPVQISEHDKELYHLEIVPENKI